MATNSERETVIRWGPSDPGVAAVWTNEPAVWRRLEKAGYAPERVTKALGGHITGKFFTVSKRLILVRSKLPCRSKGRIQNLR